jgi:hypothetical protein
MNKVNAELGDQNIARDEGGEKAEPCASLDAAIAKPPIHKQTSLAETLVSVYFYYSILFLVEYCTID